MSQQEQQDKSQYFYRASAADFEKVPTNPIAYWITNHERDLYKSGDLLGSVASPKKGLDTGENDVFIRLWHEVSFSKSCVDGTDLGKKWFPYNKGGDYRKWYGNREYLINWEDNGAEIKSRLSWDKKKPTIRNPKFYFLEGMTWTTVSSGGFSARYCPPGALFDNGGCTLFSDKDLKNLGALLNSKVATRYLEFLSPTLNFQPGDISKILCQKSILTANLIFDELVKIAKNDWDSFEFSWDFSSHPILAGNSTNIREAFNNLSIELTKTVKNFIDCEKQNERVIAECYSVQPAQENEDSLKHITLFANPVYRYGLNKTRDELERLSISDSMVSLTSFIIGCMMGRYSIDKPGLILASQGEMLQDYLNQIPNPRYMPDNDAILPLTDQEWFADDVTNRVREFVKVVWGEETLAENLTFIADSLCLHAIKPKKDETALDTIRRYLSTQFYKDHLKTYKKRPIYWLFSSGKEKAFECLVYLHRYNEGTLARMRNEYVTPLMGKFETQLTLWRDELLSAAGSQQRAIEKQIKDLEKKQLELRAFDEQLKHYADMRIQLDLDDGVKVNYGKFGQLLAEVKAVTGDKD